MTAPGGPTIYSNSSSTNIVTSASDVNPIISTNSVNLTPQSFSSKTNPEPAFPFLYDETHIKTIAPVAPLLKTSSLRDLNVELGGGKVFVDKVLPSLQEPFPVNRKFTPDYFSALHELVTSAGVYYPKDTPN